MHPPRQPSHEPNAGLTASYVLEFQQRFTAGMKEHEAVAVLPGPPFRAEVRRAISAWHHALWDSEWLCRVRSDRANLTHAIKQLYAQQVCQDRLYGAFDTVDVADLTGDASLEVQALHDAYFQLQSCWFLGRYVELMARTVLPHLVTSKKTRREARVGFSEASRTFVRVAQQVLKDHYLLDRMSPRAVRHLRELIEGVDGVSRYIAEVQSKPVDPFPNGSNSKAGDSRELILDLADSCFRTFRACTPEVMRVLLDPYELGDHYRRDDTLDELITKALDRKIDNVAQRDGMTYVIARSIVEPPWKAGVWIPHLA